MSTEVAIAFFIVTIIGQLSYEMMDYHSGDAQIAKSLGMRRNGLLLHLAPSGRLTANPHYDRYLSACDTSLPNLQARVSLGHLMAFSSLLEEKDSPSQSLALQGSTSS